MGKSIPRVNARPVPRYDKTSDDDNYQPGFRTQTHYGTLESSLAHPNQGMPAAAISPRLV